MKDTTFNIAVIGCGGWGKNHVRTAHRIWGENLRLVCDTDPANKATVDKISADIPFTSQINDVLHNQAINAVIVATPAETHYQITTACLEAGKHVLVEKPIALFSEQAQDLNDLARQSKLTLMVGHILLYHPAIRKIKELIDQGTVGRLQYLYSNRLNLGKIRKEENILWSFAPHDISVLHYLIGQAPTRVEASGSIFLQPGIHDVTLTTLEYPNNIHAHIHVSWLHPFKEQRLVVIGDKSMLVFEDSRPDNKLVLYPKGIDWVAGEPHKRDGEFQPIEFQADEPLKLELLHFQDCVLNLKTPLTDGEHGRQILRILEQAQAKIEGLKQPDAAPPEPPTDYFVHDTARVDDHCTIGKGTKIWHYSHVQAHTTIGEKCSLGQNVNVGNRVKIGNGVKIQNNVSVYEGVELEDYVFCGPSMVFTNVKDPRSEFPQRGSDFYLKTLVQYGASIGANATIVCGTTIGRFAFIGAGAVVTKDVPEYALVVGAPARIVGWVCRCGEKLIFESDQTTCIRCGRDYHRTDNTTVTCVKDV